MRKERDSVLQAGETATAKATVDSTGIIDAPVAYLPVDALSNLSAPKSRLVLLVEVKTQGDPAGGVSAPDLLTIYADMVTRAAENYAGSLNRQQGGKPRGVQLSVSVSRGRGCPDVEWDPDERPELTDKARALLACERAR